MTQPSTIAAHGRGQTVPRRLAVLLLLPLFLLLDAVPAAAQSIDISGIWRTARPSGVYMVTLEQNGTRVAGTYHLGKIQGTLTGNTLSGTYDDIVSRGKISLTFGPGDSTFQGTWRGVRVGSLAQTPAGIVRRRSGIDQVANSGLTYDEQASKACENFFVATYASGADDTWTTSRRTGGNAFAPVLGGRNGLSTEYAQIQGVHKTGPQSTRFSEADRRNGWQYRGKVSFTGSVYRVGANADWQPWQDLVQPFAYCKYEVQSGVPRISAGEFLLGAEWENLGPPSHP